MNGNTMGPIRLGPLVDEYESTIRREEELAQAAEERYKELFDRVSKAWDRVVALSELAMVITPPPIAGMTLPSLIPAPSGPIDKPNVMVPSDWNKTQIQAAGNNHGSVVLRLAIEYGNLTRGDIGAYNTARKEIDDHYARSMIFKEKLLRLKRVAPRVKSTFQDIEVV